MPHANAPLTPEGRRRLCERVESGRPIAHVAAEAAISRRCLAKWYGRWLESGDAGLLDRTSRPDSSPNMTPRPVAAYIERLRCEHKWGPARIAAAVTEFGCPISPATVHRVLVRDGLNRLSTLDLPTGETMRQVNRYEHPHPGAMVHVDVKKLGRIPDGGGWRVHGRSHRPGGGRCPAGHGWHRVRPRLGARHGGRRSEAGSSRDRAPLGGRNNLTVTVDRMPARH